MALKFFITLLFLVVTINSTTSSRILVDEDTPPGTATTLVDEDTSPGTATGAAAATGATGGGATGATGAAAVTPTTGAAAVTPTTGAAAVTPTTGAATVTSGSHEHPLTFFMHDILGGTNPSAQAVTGIVTNPAVNGQIPFAKPNGAVLATNDANSGLINNNNIPFLTGLGGSTSNVVQNNGNNNGNSGSPLFNGAQLPTGPVLQRLMFGTMTVIDDELTEGHELGSGLVGKAQGFYVSSAVDGSSQTMAFTVMFDNGNYADSLSLFGVHRTAVSQSQLAVMGGTGKYVNAKGYATVKTFPGDQHNTDGVETLLEITLYLAY